MATLHVVAPASGNHRAVPAPPWRVAADNLWPAWRELGHWQESAEAELGARLPELLLVLWTLSRLSGTPESVELLFELVSEDLHPDFANDVLEDIVGVAFALGAAWAEHRPAIAEPVRQP
jgi:hypothetical protein